MSTKKCVYVGCKKTSRDIQVFKFPVPDKDRLALWIRNSGNLFLESLTNDELRCRFICADHFPPSSIRKINIRTRLIGSAVPVHFQQVKVIEEASAAHSDEQINIDVLSSPAVLKVKTPKKFYTKRKRTPTGESTERSSPDNHFSMPSTPRMSRRCNFEGPKKRLARKFLFEAEAENIPKTKRLTNTVHRLIKKNRALQAQVKRSQDKLKQKQNLINVNDIESDVSKTLVLMQTRKRNDKSRWPKDAKKFCLSLFYKSSSTYIYLQRQGVRLAAPSTLRLWLSQTSTLPGISKNVFNNIKQRFENSCIFEKSCVLSFDEMSIMQNLEYSKNQDLIEGFEDYGGNHRTDKMAKYALIFVVRGLYKSWKMPIAYYLSATNVKAENLQLFLKAILNKLFKSGLLPKAVVCDQMSTNQKLFKNLAVTKNFPFFFCNGKKIYALYDVPHLIKNIRNNLLHNDYVYNNKTISFQDIKNTYEIDKKSIKSRSLTKITERHIRPNSFQKMTVSLATQIFSNSVAAAIRTAKSTGELSSETAIATATFVQMVNNLFVALNSKQKYNNNPHKFALSKTAFYINESIREGIAVFGSLQKKTLKKVKNGGRIEILTRPPCFDGMVQSCEAVLQLFHEESTDDSIDFLITSRLNQDVCENLFARFRQKGGDNRNPTAKQLRTIFRSSMVDSLIKLPSSKNCEDEDGKFVENIDRTPSDVDRSHFSQSQMIEQERVSSSRSSSFCSAKGLQLQVSQRQSNLQIPTSAEINKKPKTLEHCSVTYFAGYLAMHCLKNNNNCNICITKLIRTDVDLEDKNHLLILNKSYDFNTSIKLKMPSDEMIGFVSLALDGFNLYFQHMVHVKNLKSRLLKLILQHLSSEKQSQNVLCNDHLLYIVEQMIIVKLHFYCKDIKRNNLENKIHPKLRILKNI